MRTVRAISFGVFWRSALSTSSTMRSRKDSPGLVETRMRMLSLRTLVPPVTPLRSPPLSLITGALSPVIALSSMLATPSMTVPSAGMISPAVTRRISPFLRSVAFTTVMSPFFPMSFAGVSILALRRVSA